ncbi:MAG TPA: hypothetical protein VD811_05080 [Desulfuromonadales bacterium]|nr:hypothetical protein [Desulfuromonadales bacterium]
MKPFPLLLLLIVSGILFEILFRPFGRLAALIQRLQRLPARFTDRRRNALPAAGLSGSSRRPLADDAWRPAAQF